MLTVFIRAIIVYVVIVAIFRMMGKRQIGEMEPYELVITLIIAEVACVPMGDKSIPLSSGLISALTLFILHQITVLITKNGKIQKVLSGKPVLVVDKEGINYNNLKSLNMRASDLLQAMRAAGYFSLEEINYALFETNGQLTVVGNPIKQKEDNKSGEFPVPVIVDGEWSSEELNNKINRQFIETKINQMNLTVADIILMTVDGSNHAVMQAKNQKVKTFNFKNEVIKVEGGNSL
ncbi:MAG: DUF421 domain-containing protein [Clostridia bacterium]